MKVCGSCGHPMSAHETIDHDRNNPGLSARLGAYRYTTVCTQDLDHVEGDSPWDHVCGCVWSHDTVSRGQVAA